MARVDQGTCYGCQIQLPTINLQQARSGNLVQCSNCGRILFQLLPDIISQFSCLLQDMIPPVHFLPQWRPRHVLTQRWPHRVIFQHMLFMRAARLDTEFKSSTYCYPSFTNSHRFPSSNFSTSSAEPTTSKLSLKTR